jgi:hypothetical protein
MHCSIVAKILTSWKILVKLERFAATDTGALRCRASIKPKYLPNRAGDCRFLD